jgi:Trk K+ transport system NAD-binding subunit
MGQSLARRIIAGDAMAHVIGKIDELLLAEAAAAHTPLVGKTLQQANLLQVCGVSVVGVWESGSFVLPSEDLRVSEKSIFVLVGTQQHVDRYNELFCIYNINSAPILIIGGGSVGKALAAALRERDLEYRIVERSPALMQNDRHYLLGDAGNPEVLARAGIAETPAVAVTSHEDAINIYLTTFIRTQRADVQIISRATLDHSVRALQQAGCDFVVSHASLGANNILSFAKQETILMIAEGVEIFSVRTPSSLIGKTLAETHGVQECGCRIIAVNNNRMESLDLSTVLQNDATLMLIGSVEAEERFIRKYVRR